MVDDWNMSTEWRRNDSEDSKQNSLKKHKFHFKFHISDILNIIIPRLYVVIT